MLICILPFATNNRIMEEILLPEHPNESSIKGVDNEVMARKLLENSKAAIFAAVELHNKPIFPYRYEMTVILTINAWELALKAYLITFRPDVKVFHGDFSKEFLNCVGSVNMHLHNEFETQKENIELIYKYRCDTIHFYSEGIELILYSLLRPNILYFSEFLLKHFKIDLASEADLIILPIGFNRMVTPVDFISENLVSGNEPTKEFIKSIIKSAKSLEEKGFTDGLICNYNFNIESVSKVKNADIVVGITNETSEAAVMINKTIKKGSFTHDENAPKFKIEEESLFNDIFTINSKDFIKKLKEAVPRFLENNTNKNIIKKEIKGDADCFKIKYLDAVPTAKSIGKGFYSQIGVDKAISLFKKD